MSGRLLAGKGQGQVSVGLAQVVGHPECELLEMVFHAQVIAPEHSLADRLVLGVASI